MKVGLLLLYEFVCPSLCGLDVEAAEAELARLVDIINFGGQENLKTRETEVVLEVIRNNLR